MANHRNREKNKGQTPVEFPPTVAPANEHPKNELTVVSGLNNHFRLTRAQRLELRQRAVGFRAVLRH